MEVKGKKYIQVSIATANIVDSFVVPANKAGSGSGEARLYVSSQKSDEYGSFFTFDPRINIDGYVGAQGQCFFTKENLTKYMEDIKVFYDFPIIRYRKDVSLFYDNRLDQIQMLDNINNFQVYNQSGDLDADRFYIGSKSHFWDLMREISLPHPLTILCIHKLVNCDDESDVQYYFELFVVPKSASRHLTSRTHSIRTIREEIQNDTTISETERKSIFTSRLGQGKFRRNTLDIMPACPFTNITEKSLLRASHIIPWAHCHTNHHRLDGFNGMSLTPTFDLLFDRGLISFEDDGRLKVSSYLSQSIVYGLNLQEGYIYEIANSSGRKNMYLDYHRRHIFIA
ncbi:HNH endonuclease [Rossellomorea sp. GAMAL-10_SWC]